MYISLLRNANNHALCKNCKNVTVVVLLKQLFTVCDSHTLTDYDFAASAAVRRQQHLCSHTVSSRVNLNSLFTPQNLLNYNYKMLQNNLKPKIRTFKCLFLPRSMTYSKILKFP